MNSGPQEDGPLAGYRVLDLSHILAGPYCTMILVDLGAEVIKVERPDGGDPARAYGPFLEGQSAYFMSLNRGKKSITLNLKSPKGKDIAMRLAEKCDVLVENFRPGTLERLGLGYERIKKVNPGMIVASVTGFGQSGPWRDRPALDVIVQALSGSMSITGEPDGPPMRTGFSIGDIIPGIFAALAVLAALVHRERTGEGQRIDVSMFDCLLALLENAIVRYTSTGEVPPRYGSRHPSIAPFDTFKARDGYVAIGVVSDSLWERFCKVLGRKELIRDGRFRDNESRSRNYEELKDIVEAWTSQLSREEVVSRMLSDGVPSGEVNTIDMAVECEQTRTRQMVLDVRYPSGGSVRMANSPLRLELTPGRIRGAPPVLGEHTEEVLSQLLGMSEEEVSRLRREGAV
ncbi:MAG: CaiB/BaiF CoA transferase family protein [Thermoplasmata archaeon]